MASSFTINQADLAFILKQIKIAEATSLAYNAAPKTILQSIMDTYGLSAADAAIAPFGLRTVDGSFNSLVPGQSTFGAADTLFPRLTDPVFRNEGDEHGILLASTNTTTPARQCCRRRPAHHFQPGRRHDGRQSGGGRSGFEPLGVQRRDRGRGCSCCRCRHRRGLR